MVGLEHNLFKALVFTAPPQFSRRLNIATSISMVPAALFQTFVLAPIDFILRTNWHDRFKKAMDKDPGLGIIASATGAGLEIVSVIAGGIVAHDKLMEPKVHEPRVEHHSSCNSQISTSWVTIAQQAGQKPAAWVLGGTKEAA
jgi:hypothetical protein